jgi:phage terminase large subunit-like protein
VCRRRGAHYCAPRADKVVAFFAEVLVHTKGRWARRSFTLEAWQEHDIIRPLFGEVVWDADERIYRRRYTVAGIILGRKNGKSEICAGIVLYLLVADDEEAAEIYGAAKDTKQAGKVYEPTRRMMKLSAILDAKQGGRLDENKNARRIFDEGTDSYYEIITADAMGELGHNPHGFVLDEVLSQRDDSLWNALRTAAGTRLQPLFVLASTETNDPASFGADMIDELEKIQADPKRAPHWFAYVRKTPIDADPWDEKNWYHPNPALTRPGKPGGFLSITALREEALEAKLDPTKENAFRQYRLNQRVQQQTRWMQLTEWDPCGKLSVEKVREAALARSRCYGGLDLASTTDLAAWALFFKGDPNLMLWRFWTPAARVPVLDEHTGGKFSVWVREGLVRATPGDEIDYETIHADIARDLEDFEVLRVGYDPWGATATKQWLEGRGIAMERVAQTYEGLSTALGELMRLVKRREFEHGGNPVMRWNADSIEVKHPADQPDVIKPVKPDRNASGKRIDGMVAATIAIAASYEPEVAAPVTADASAATGTDDLWRPRSRLDI